MCYTVDISKQVDPTLIFFRVFYLSFFSNQCEKIVSSKNCSAPARCRMSTARSWAGILKEYKVLDKGSAYKSAGEHGCNMFTNLSHRLAIEYAGVPTLSPAFTRPTISPLSCRPMSAVVSETSDFNLSAVRGRNIGL